MQATNDSQKRIVDLIQRVGIVNDIVVSFVEYKLERV